MIELLPKPKEVPKKTFKILIVEDSESILYAIHDYLLPYYEISTASSIEEAFAILQNVPIDLIIADIHLGDGNGFALFSYCRKFLPQIKIILITAYDINSYLPLLESLQAEVVISKYGTMSLAEIFVACEKLLSGDIFGVKKYFPEIKEIHLASIEELAKIENQTIYHFCIKSSKERGQAIDKISQNLCQVHPLKESLCKIVLDEISTNAMYRACRKEDGQFKYQRFDEVRQIYIPQRDVELEKEDYFTLSFGIYEDWLIFAAKDFHGILTAKEILYHLKRHGTINPKTGLPEGIADTHGRGIFLLRESVSHVIYNIHHKKATEVICLAHRQVNNPQKNISIFQVY